MERMPRGLGLIYGVLLACTATCLSSCAAQQKILGRSVANQKVAIVVHISDEVNAADQAGGVAELVQTISDGLKDHGMDSEIYTAADDHPPPPRIELNVVYWSETNQDSRILAMTVGLIGKAVGPNNRMIVDCGVVLDSSERRVLWQRFQAGKGFGGRDEAAAGGNAASLILSKILKN